MVAAKLAGSHLGFGTGLTVFEDPSQRISELGRDDNGDVLLVYYYR
jgi:hypothetical protein